MRASRLKVGVDVPWVTSWSEEEVLGVGPCPTVNGLAAVRQRERAECGRPQYSLNHYVRQRASIRGLLCPMCGAPTPAENRWTLTGKLMTAGAVRERGLGFALPPDLPDKRIVLNAGSVSPGHRACMQRSLEQCPHLSSTPELELLAFPETWWVSPLQVEAVRGGEYFLARPQRPEPMQVVGFLQLCGITDRSEPGWRSRPG